MIEAFIAGGLTAAVIGLIGLLFRARGRELSIGALVGVAIPVALVAFLLRHSLPGLEGPPPSAEAMTQEAFAANPSLGLLAKEHPEIRDRMKRMLDSLITAGTSRRELYGAGMAWGRAVLTPYLKQYLPIASDDALVAFGTASSDLLEGLRKTPDACMDYLFGPVPGKTVNRLPEVMEQKFEKVLQQVIRSGIDNPHDPMPMDQARKQVQSLVTALVGKWGPSGATALEAFANPSKARQDPAQSCNIAYQLYRYVIDEPPDVAPPTLRALFTVQ